MRLLGLLRAVEAHSGASYIAPASTSLRVKKAPRWVDPIIMIC